MPGVSREIARSTFFKSYELGPEIFDRAEKMNLIRARADGQYYKSDFLPNPTNMAVIFQLRKEVVAQAKQVKLSAEEKFNTAVAKKVAKLSKNPVTAERRAMLEQMLAEMGE